MVKLNRPQKISDYFKIQPDNLSKREKLFLSVISILLFIGLAFCVSYIYSMKKDRKEIKDGIGYENCVFEVVGSRLKFNKTIFSYTVSGKVYNHGFKNTSGLKINEKYQGRIKKSRPDICLIYLTKPIIDSLDYKSTKAEILNSGKLKNKEWIEFKYQLKNKTFKRQQYVENLEDFNIGIIVEILYDTNNPKISYVKK